MYYLEAYLNKITARGNVKLAESVLQTADDIGERQLKTFSFTSNETGLLFGNVQSGKTGQMFGIICRAADLGFPVFVLLTTDNVVLQQQTLARVCADLDGLHLRRERCAALHGQQSHSACDHCSEKECTCFEALVECAHILRVYEGESPIRCR